MTACLKHDYTSQALREKAGSARPAGDDGVRHLSPAHRKRRLHYDGGMRETGR